jgi:methylglyoxal/glyoxal reductase
MRMMISDIRGTAELTNGIPMPYFGFGVFKVRDGLEVKQAVSHALSAR